MLTNDFVFQMINLDEYRIDLSVFVSVEWGRKFRGMINKITIT